MRIELTYLTPRGMNGHENVCWTTKTIEVRSQQPDDVADAWSNLHQTGFFWDRDTLIPCSAVIAVSKSKWMGRI